MAMALPTQGGQHRRQHVPGPTHIDAFVAQDLVKVEGVNPHRLVIACAVHDQIQPPGTRLAHHLSVGGSHCVAVGHVQWHSHAARMIPHEILQGGLIAGRHKHLGAQAMQVTGRGPPDSGGGTHHPGRAIGPVLQPRVQ